MDSLENPVLEKAQRVVRSSVYTIQQMERSLFADEQFLENLVKKTGNFFTPICK